MTQIPGQRSMELIGFVELILLLIYQFCVTVFTTSWFKTLEEENKGYLLALLILSNAGAAFVQITLSVLLVKGVNHRNLTYCEIWYYNTLVTYWIFVPTLLISLILYPFVLAPWLALPIVFVVYRGLSLKIMKDFIRELLKINNLACVQWNKDSVIF